MNLPSPSRRFSLTLAIFALGLVLRIHHLATMPPSNDTADEYAWTWGGMTLLDEGVPQSWSWMPAYHHFPILKWHDAQYRLVKPWLDHPPLYPLFMGVWMRLGGFHDIFSVDITYMRWSSILLYLLTFPLLAAVFTRTLERRVALASLLIYVTLPLAVFHSRLVISENLLVPLFLAGLYAWLRWMEDSRRRWLVLLAACMFLMPLTKTAGVALNLVLFSLCVMKLKWSAARLIAIATAAGIGAHLLYGMHFDRDLFRAVMEAQSQRFIGFDSGYQLMFVQKLVATPVVALPCILGALVLLAELLKGNGDVWSLLFVVYAAALVFFADQSYTTGWYALPLFPALAVGLGRFAVAFWDRPDGAYLWLWLLFLLVGPLDLLLARHAEWKSALRFVYLVALVGVPVAIARAKQVGVSRYRGVVACLFALQLAADLSQIWTR